MLNDLKFAIRRAWRAPVFSTAVIVVLGVGIGASTTVLSVVNAFYWRPIAIADAAQLVAIGARAKDGVGMNLAFPVVEAAAQSGLPIDGVCAYGSTLAATDANRQSMMTSIMVVDGSCLSTFRVRPALGRLIGVGDAPLGKKGQPVVMLSHAYWQRAFNGAADVVGRTLRIEDATMTIVGVLPKGFTGLSKDVDADLVVPFSSYRTNSGAPYAVGRLRAGVSATDLEARLAAAWPGLAGSVTGRDRDRWLESRPEVRPAGAGLSTLRNLYGDTTIKLAALAGLLLALASLNVGGLLCARLASANGELGILRALGASRGRIVRSMLVEAGLLALAGCAVGLPVAAAAAPAFVRLMPQGNQAWSISFAPDRSVFAVSVVVALVVALVVTAIPAWLATRRRDVVLQADRAMTRSTSRTAQVLLILQVAATLVIVFGCSLLATSLTGLEGADRGYAGRDVVSIRLLPTAGGYAGLDQAAYYPELIDRVGRLSGVQSVGMARYFGTVPNERGWYNPVGWSGQPEALTTAIFEYAMPGFFEAVGIPLLRGRSMAWSDGASAAPVVLVSESLARALDPAGEVVGRYIRFGADEKRQRLQIVGVVGNVSFGNTRAVDIRTVYFPGLQANEATYGTLHVKADTDAATIAAGVREILAGYGHEQIAVVSTVDGLFANWMTAERMGATVSGVASVLALTVACVGVFALLAYAVARRTREMGIRMAIGATGRDVAALVIRDAGKLAAIGVTLGVPAALGAASGVESLMFGVTTRDPWMLFGSSVLLAAVVLTASLVPALRASRVDPMIALRAE